MTTVGGSVGTVLVGLGVLVRIVVVKRSVVVVVGEGWVGVSVTTTVVVLVGNTSGLGNCIGELKNTLKA